jgi:hypothetical protein
MALEIIKVRGEMKRFIVAKINIPNEHMNG